VQEESPAIESHLTPQEPLPPPDANANANAIAYLTPEDLEFARQHNMTPEELIQLDRDIAAADEKFGHVPWDSGDSETVEELINGSVRSRYGFFQSRQTRVSEERARLEESEERLRACAARAQRLLSKTADGDARSALYVVRLLRQMSIDLETYGVLVARKWGWSWKSIATELGVAAQTLHERYGLHKARPGRRR
jgi:hypothetical protein